MHISSPTLSTFPLEVVLEICGYLETPKDRLNLACCSRRFHELFLPLLYKNLWTGGKLLRPIVQVVNTLAKNPSLAASVETVHLSAWETYLGFNEATFEQAFHGWQEDLRINGDDEHLDWSQDGSINLKDVDFDPLYEQAKRVARSDDEARFWMSEVKMGNGDAWVALLLTLLPNVQRLEAEFPYCALWIHYVLKWAINGSFRQIPAFPHLEKAFVDWDSDDTQICTQHLMPFVLLPSMRRFHAKNLRGASGFGYDTVGDAPEMVGTSPVTHIEIDGSDGDWDLSKLMSSCQTLLSFRYFHRGCKSFEPHALYNDLLPFKESLETVWLDIQERFRRHKSPHNCDDPLPSFRDFTALKTLHLRMKNLPNLVTGAEGEEDSSVTSLGQFLPSSIETLQIADPGSLDNLRTFSQKLQHHVEHDMEFTPVLARITFKSSLLFMQTSDLLEDMTKACAKANIKFRVGAITDGPITWGPAAVAPSAF
ncbi:hypothetical protein FE257_011882 [Aspergillus nanangensis]|uniref:F-box domain-containing protein n=1 Tax=Aspergillus nanangensis TaxID=2582783 RepID=A0AAD4CGW4_ASPNN|nr:hypothetical protein FE257_011882 [Aspergillus nanangensis]